MKRYDIKRALIAVLALCCLAASLLGCAPEVRSESNAGPGVEAVLERDGALLESYETFLRIDRDYADAWSWELENLRIFSEGCYTLGEPKEKYRLDLSYPVSTQGLDDLHISASAQFSEQQFRTLADTLRSVADGKKIVIVDLREESHYFLNGISISSFRLHNWGNLGVSREEIEAREAEYFESLQGKTITAYMEDDDLPQTSEQLTMTVERVMSERELVESEGFTYLRLPITDHAFPTPDEIDEFIARVRELGTEDTWFHFHCHAGQGRTGIFMTLYDKMCYPELPMQDILYRHAMTGSSYPLYLGDGSSYKLPLYAEKTAMTPLLFAYVEQQHPEGYALTFAQWLEENQTEAEQ